jgi:hypothetical protein
VRALRSGSSVGPSATKNIRAGSGEDALAGATLGAHVIQCDEH